ncbi:dihydrodipicolinate synthase family protein [Aureispira anguillae]|uniref:Dihydrodipicolinate synthase family protein n=1 Tax=Aureispira anguillae TaxID=2864201 RepID=A0A915YAQ7_9BACT|nr:dihydrodipicolinate synthase family protein [Aureispira anguillae]BDS09406.1 dihydrodipicolinate synthase family protein [Aureispira anguillae]
MKTTIFKGIIAYPITPFTKEEKVDLPLFKTLVERLVVHQANAIAPLGSTGVLPYLSDDEKEAVVKATIEQVNGRVPVLVGVSNLTTAKTVQHAQHAERLGAQAVMIIPMSYWKLTDDEIYEHYQTVANNISIPIMAYNNPATSGVDMSPQLLERLLTIPAVTMIKESTGDIQRMHYLKKVLGEKVDFFNGSNPLALGAFVAGATGWCTAAHNLIPQLNINLYQCIKNGKLEEAQRIFYQQVDLLKFIVEKGLPRSVQAGLELLGEKGGHLRSPLKPLSQKDKEQLKQLLFAAIS